ncbi:hypothetical protein JCM10908_006614 [Rhodotorula pacifica]|uniref:uncharacterized protein n=1 Tax=Rhodotorula pacifica TaxID=1495444 RepID=UPI00317A7C1C
MLEQGNKERYLKNNAVACDNLERVRLNNDCMELTSEISWLVGKMFTQRIPLLPAAYSVLMTTHRQVQVRPPQTPPDRPRSISPFSSLFGSMVDLSPTPPDQQSRERTQESFAAAELVYRPVGRHGRHPDPAFPFRSDAAAPSAVTSTSLPAATSPATPAVLTVGQRQAFIAAYPALIQEIVKKAHCKVDSLAADATASDTKEADDAKTAAALWRNSISTQLAPGQGPPRGVKRIRANLYCLLAEVDNLTVLGQQIEWPVQELFDKNLRRSSTSLSNPSLVLPAELLLAVNFIYKVATCRFDQLLNCALWYTKSLSMKHRNDATKWGSEMLEPEQKRRFTKRTRYIQENLDMLVSNIDYMTLPGYFSWPVAGLATNKLYDYSERPPAQTQAEQELGRQRFLPRSRSLHQRVSVAQLFQ